MSNSLGRIFRITSFGESHGRCVGVVVDGCPAGLRLTNQDIQEELNRRRPGQSRLTTSRSEEDRVEVIVPRDAIQDVLRAAREAHPYEEMAYDIYPLLNHEYME